MKCLYFILLFILSYSLNGQPSRPVRVFGTQAFNRSLEQAFPEIRARRAALDEEVRVQVKEAFDPTWLEKEIILPIVFHWLIPEGKKAVSLEVMEAQLQATHRHFSEISFAAEYPVDTLLGLLSQAGQIQLNFCFRDPENGSPWVESRISQKKEWPVGTAVMEPSKGGLGGWNPERYINVWVAELEGNLAGFAQYPGGIPDFDGIVIDPDFLGLKEDNQHPYAQGKTFTHLMGSYLGLYEMWNSYSLCGDDEVKDTPIHNASNYGRPEYMHYSMCAGQGIEMTANYMDGVDDVEMFLFTHGQVKRIATMLFSKGPRKKLTQQTSLCLLKSKYEEKWEDYDLSLTPNPAKDQISLYWNQSKAYDLHLTLWNPEGKQVRSWTLPGKTGSNTTSMDLGSLPGGLYILTGTGKEFVFTKRFVLQH